MLCLIAWHYGDAQLFYKSRAFKVVEAKKQVFYPGVQGSPITTTVTCFIIAKKCTKLELDSFWMDGFADKVGVRYKNGDTWDNKPTKGDTLVVNFTYYRSTAMPMIGAEILPDMTGSSEANAPVDHKGAMLFRFENKGKKGYFSIKDVEMVNSVYAP